MEKQKVALVLSSGGARGIAHIGVIEGLIANGYEISSVSGSSVGSLIGAYVACGELDVYKKWVCELDRLNVFKLIDFTFSTSGFIRGEKVFKSLEAIIPDRQIEDFTIPYAAVATDILNKEELVMKSGSMYQVIKASIAIPTVIRPVEYKNHKLIDGGVINPLPVNRVARTEGDILVVSNVNSIIPYEPTVKVMKEASIYSDQLNRFKSRLSKLLPDSSSLGEKFGYFDLLNQSIDLMQDQLTQLLLDQYKPDISASISRDACSTFEFYRAEEMIAAGRAAIESAIIAHRKSNA
jgi:NTE family protein